MRGGCGAAVAGGATSYLRQYAGVNSTITLKISSRPSSIAAVHSQVCAAVRQWKLCTAPGGPKPWAVLLIEATLASSAGSKPSPASSSAKVKNTTVMKYRKMNASTAWPTLSG